MVKRKLLILGILCIILACAIGAFAQQENAPAPIAGSGVPQGAIAQRIGTIYIDTSTNDVYICTTVTRPPGPAQSTCTWTKQGTGTGSGTVSGQTANCIPKASGATALTTCSSLSDNATTVSTTEAVSTGALTATSIPSPGAIGGTTPAAGTFTTLTAANVPVFNVTAYGAVADASTDNATALASVFTASNAITSGIPTVYFTCETGKQCQYNYSAGIHPTIPTTIRCDPGVTLDYTGSAHAVDLGPTTLTGSTYQTTYVVQGCRFTGGAMMTEGIYVNNLVLAPRILNNTFLNWGGTNNVFGIYFNGEVDDPLVQGNTFIDIDNAVHNMLRVDPGSGGAISSQLRFIDNWGYAAMPPGMMNMEGGSSADNAGIGVWAAGIKSQIKNNNLNWFQPDVRIGSQSIDTDIVGNSFEAPQATVSTGVIQYGDPAGGYAPTFLIEGLTVENNEADLHAVNDFMVPTTNTSVIANTIVSNNTLSEVIPSLDHDPVIQNNIAGQLNNKGRDNRMSATYAGYTNFVPAAVQSMVPVWPNIGNVCLGGAGGLGCPQIFSDLVNFDANLSRLAADTWAVGDNALGVGNVNGAMAMKTLELTTQTVNSLPNAAAGNAGWVRQVTNSTAIAAEGQTCVDNGGTGVVALAFSTGSAWKCF